MMNRTPFLLNLTALLCSFLLCGCRSIEDRYQESAHSQAADKTIPLAPDEADLSREELEKKERARLEKGDYAVRINRTLIYPCRWLRAEELAVTLQPLLESRYGSNVRVVPHPVTNQLLIYIPPLHEQDRVTRRAVSTASTGRSRTVSSSGGTTVRRAGR